MSNENDAYIELYNPTKDLTGEYNNIGIIVNSMNSQRETKDIYNINAYASTDSSGILKIRLKGSNIPLENLDFRIVTISTLF